MKALVYDTNFDGNYKLVEREKPTIKDSKDAIVEVTMSSICTSDLHIIHGQVPRANNNIVLGHEYVGKVVEVGSDVKNLKVGDRVSANCETFCGECFFCKRGFINNCEKGALPVANFLHAQTTKAFSSEVTKESNKTISATTGFATGA